MSTKTGNRKTEKPVSLLGVDKNKIKIFGDRLNFTTALDGHRLLSADKRILGWPGELDRLAAIE